MQRSHAVTVLHVQGKDVLERIPLSRSKVHVCAFVERAPDPVEAAVRARREAKRSLRLPGVQLVRTLVSPVPDPQRFDVRLTRFTQAAPLAGQCPSPRTESSSQTVGRCICRTPQSRAARFARSSTVGPGDRRHDRTLRGTAARTGTACGASTMMQTPCFFF